MNLRTFKRDTKQFRELVFGSLFKCGAYPRYKAVRAPQCGCVSCWRKWFLARKPEDQAALIVAITLETQEKPLE